jgi:ABC-type transport system involved in multi-copper enzyme maturation permease subunit
MYIFNNPVLQRELLTNLRAPRAFVLLLVYQVILAGVVLIAYPRDIRIDLTNEFTKVQGLVDFFFLGQFAIASLMAPSFAASAITGEKERKTYEMLLASPIRPWSIVLGKLIASLTHLTVLMVASLPIIMLCLPLGGVAIQEVVAAYVGLLASVFLFGSISIACSSYFKRTSSSLVVSYSIILPMVVLGCVFWRGLENQGFMRLALTTFVLPIAALSIGGALLHKTALRLLYPPDVGSGGNEVTDLEKEQDEAIGLVIQRDAFPDRLFAPPRRRTLLADGANPVFDKEIHAELFSQGTLMLRLVVQLSILLALPLMAILLFYAPNYAGWYIGYVILFNVLVSPVFTAGSVCSERERQTLDLLLTTTLTPWQVLWGKFAAGFRVSFVLTMFLMWPVVLACVLNPDLAKNWLSMLVFLAMVVVASLFNALLGLFCSTLFNKTSNAMMGTYSILIFLYFAPIAVFVLASTFSEDASQVEPLRWLGGASPLLTLDSVPFSDLRSQRDVVEAKKGSWILIGAYFSVTLFLIIALAGTVILLFRDRWRLAGKS